MYTNIREFLCLKTQILAKERKMAIRPIEKTTNKNKTTSYTTAGLLGMTCGLAAKHLIPVSKQEYDTFISENLIKGHKKLNKKEISVLAKVSRSTFDFAIVTALTFMALNFYKNMYRKLADK